MTTLVETLERIRELDPKLVRIVGNMYGSIYLFNGVPSDNRHEFREKMLDWLVGRSFGVDIRLRGHRCWVEIFSEHGPYWDFAWWHDGCDVEAESELHALALCVVKVLENSPDNAPRSPVDER